jgi:hypothetical protein
MKSSGQQCNDPSSSPWLDALEHLPELPPPMAILLLSQCSSS